MLCNLFCFFTLFSFLTRFIFLHSVHIRIFGILKTISHLNPQVLGQTRLVYELVVVINALYFLLIMNFLSSDISQPIVFLQVRPKNGIVL